MGVLHVRLTFPIPRCEIWAKSKFAGPKAAGKLRQTIQLAERKLFAFSKEKPDMPPQIAWLHAQSCGGSKKMH